MSTWMSNFSPNRNVDANLLKKLNPNSQLQCELLFGIFLLILRPTVMEKSMDVIWWLILTMFSSLMEIINDPLNCKDPQYFD